MYLKVQSEHYVMTIDCYGHLRSLYYLLGVLRRDHCYYTTCHKHLSIYLLTVPTLTMTMTLTMTLTIPT
jgi:hypothetical protein